MFPWLFNVCMDALMKEEKSEVSGGRREGRLPGLLYADDLVLCGESKENQRAMVAVEGKEDWSKGKENGRG